VDSEEEKGPSVMVMLQDRKNQCTVSIVVPGGERRWIEFHEGIEVDLMRFGKDDLKGRVMYQFWSER
jgi:CRISPR/Cas system CMR-associated protein Cmr3 (group 5 of RAMP superfamily)